MTKIKVAIAGVTGYSGEELLRILLQHPAVEIRKIYSGRERGKSLNHIYPWTRSTGDLPCEAFSLDDVVGSSLDAVFLALPHQTAFQYVPALYKAGLRVIDISADYRLRQKKLYSEYYGFEHSDEAHLQHAVYGLTEWKRESIRQARLVANPGCYPTSIFLALYPLLKSKIFWEQGLMMDAKSGVTGAGRKASEALLFSEVYESFKAYKVQGHQHEAEIGQFILELGGAQHSFVFVPHLIPINRGILSTLYVRPKKKMALSEWHRLFVDTYRGERFVHVLPEGEFPETKFVRHTNQCHIGLAWREKENTLVIVSAIDNLQKGASGQAVQNMNVMFGLDEAMGLA